MIDFDGKDNIESDAQDVSPVPAEEGEAPVAEAEAAPADIAPVEKEKPDSRPYPSACEQPPDEKDGAFAIELTALTLKVMAVALSVVLLILSIITVVAPVSAMRAFNKLGMTERALESAEMYINRELTSHDAFGEDKAGNFTGVTAAAMLSDDLDFIEALDVCCGLSYTLMNDMVSSGDMDSAIYFAEKTEKYTRMYSSLSDIGTLNKSKDSANRANISNPALWPYVYSYSHTIMKSNYRARTILGTTDKMLYNINRAGDCMTTVSERSQTFQGRDITADSLDEFVDYVDQLGEYLNYEFERICRRENIPLKEIESYKYLSDKARDEGLFLQNGDFSLFITRAGGFSSIYKWFRDGVYTYKDYAQFAYEYVPDTLEARLRQLYWLQALNSAALKMYYMSAFLYINYDVFGVQDILNDYNSVFYHCIEDAPGHLLSLSNVYEKKLESYLAIIKAQA